MKKNSKILIIVLLIILTAAIGAIWGFDVYKNNKTSAENPSETTTVQAEEPAVSAEETDALLKQQALYVNGVTYRYRNDSSNLKHDAIGATVYNNSPDTVKSFAVAFCAFDENGNPIKILQPGEEGEGGYIRTIKYDYSKAKGDVKSLEPGLSCDDILMYVHNEPQIVTVKACVKSCVKENDESWENPYYKTFMQVYSGKALS